MRKSADANTRATTGTRSTNAYDTPNTTNNRTGEKANTNRCTTVTAHGAHDTEKNNHTDTLADTEALSIGKRDTTNTANTRAHDTTSDSTGSGTDNDNHNNTTTASDTE